MTGRKQGEFHYPPRLMGEGEAARYCGVGSTLFRRECGLRPVRIGMRVLWDRHALDAWIDLLIQRQGSTTARRSEPDEPSPNAEALERLRVAMGKSRRGRKRGYGERE